jgi:glycosyltransferase involved in cell wall biosynthesis
MKSPLLVEQSSDQAAMPAASGARTVRVLHMVNGEFYAGAERVQDLLALRLPELGFEVGFACLKPGRFAVDRQSHAAPLVNVPMRSKFDLLAAARLARYVRDEGYGLIHTHTPRSLLVGRPTALWAGVPLVHHIHSQTTTEVGRRWASRVNAWTERACLAGVPAVIAVSPSAARYVLGQGIRRRTIHVVPNGIPVRPLVDRSPPSGTWTIGVVALFRPRKGLETLLEAIAGLRSQGESVRLRAVGPFETEAYRQEVDRLIADLGLADAIDWTGFTRDVPAELARMDLFVLPSLLAEGLPMVVLEAMSAGVPVIGSRVDGISDVIADGYTGLLSPPGDAAALADCLARMIHGEVDWRALRRAAWRQQVERFSDASMAEGVAAVYREVLSA